MDVEVKYQPSNSAAQIHLKAGDQVIAEAGSLIAMNENVEVTTTTRQKGKGSILKGLKRMFGGESFFLNHYQCQGDQAELWLSPGMPGDMKEITLAAGQKFIVQAGSFLCCDSTVDIDVGWQGFKNFLSGESLFWLELSGPGDVVLSSFGAIYEVNVEGSYVVDTGHIVAFDETLDFSISKAGQSWLHSFMGGEGLVCNFKGHGRVWCQSHSTTDFGHTLTPHLRPKKR